MHWRQYLPADGADWFQLAVLVIAVYVLLRLVRGTIAASILRGTFILVSLALGILPAAEFKAMETPFGKGDRLVLFTDGVTETFDGHEVEYGEERLAAYLSSHARLDAHQLIEGVLADVLAFAGPVRPRDDMTLMVVSRT